MVSSIPLGHFAPRAVRAPDARSTSRGSRGSHCGSVESHSGGSRRIRAGEARSGNRYQPAGSVRTGSGQSSPHSRTLTLTSSRGRIGKSPGPSRHQSMPSCASSRRPTCPSKSSAGSAVDASCRNSRIRADRSISVRRSRGCRRCRNRPFPTLKTTTIGLSEFQFGGKISS